VAPVEDANLGTPLTADMPGEVTGDMKDMERRFDAMLGTAGEKAEFIAYCKPFLCEVRRGVTEDADYCGRAIHH
jgi:hypothetical protein